MQAGWVAVVGSVNMDVVVPVQRLPAPGETVLGGDHAQLPGGKGANQAVRLARLGRPVALIGRVGRDGFGVRLRQHLTSQGVDTRWLFDDDDAPTGLAAIVVASDGENQIAVSPGANAHLTPADVAAADLTEAAAVLCQLEVPVATIEQAAALASGPFVLNPAPAQPLPQSLVRRVDVLVPNRSELQVLAGAESPPADLDEVAELARRLGVGSCVVTLGADGALCVEGSTVTHIPAVPVDVVDTTGAGDAFCAGLVDALVRGAEVVEAARAAVQVAAVAVTAPGAQGG
ncbi:MAG TPA: ribokinase [Natronosporangium sp.]